MVAEGWREASLLCLPDGQSYDRLTTNTERTEDVSPSTRGLFALLRALGSFSGIVVQGNSSAVSAFDF